MPYMWEKAIPGNLRMWGRGAVMMDSLTRGVCCISKLVIGCDLGRYCAVYSVHFTVYSVQCTVYSAGLVEGFSAEQYGAVQKVAEHCTYQSYPLHLLYEYLHVVKNWFKEINWSVLYMSCHVCHNMRLIWNRDLQRLDLKPHTKLNKY